MPARLVRRGCAHDLARISSPASHLAARFSAPSSTGSSPPGISGTLAPSFSSRECGRFSNTRPTANVVPMRPPHTARSGCWIGWYPSTNHRSSRSSGNVRICTSERDVSRSMRGGAGWEQSDGRSCSMFPSSSGRRSIELPRPLGVRRVLRGSSNRSSRGSTCATSEGGRRAGIPKRASAQEPRSS